MVGLSDLLVLTDARTHNRTMVVEDGCPLLVVVAGVPGSGKSTLAAQLAAALDLPLISLDAIKEALHDAPGGASRTRGDMRMAAEVVMARRMAQTLSGAVVDIWLDPTRDDRDRLRATLPPELLVREVFCDVPAETAVTRYAGRVRHGPHLPPDKEVLSRIRAAVELLAEGSSFAPRGLGPVLRVDTSREVVIPDLVTWLSAGRGKVGSVKED